MANEQIEKALRTLILAKEMRTRIKRQEDWAKSLLSEEMRPGDRRTVLTDGGDAIGKVTLSAAPQPAPRIVDPMALARWCEAHGINHGGVESVEFPEWFTSRGNLEGLIGQAGGEIPDGVEIPEAGAPRLVVPRASQAEQDAIRAALQSVVLPMTRFLEVSGRDGDEN